ncbi:AraC family transcriptional regulator [Paraburkholderia unamae]|uniref:AraC-like DNA-binding protein n=1 Tax=Paraburkholderia unamae TaxID=219649 RepID=A0ABX5KK41_9BURK|nr:AraC family transcriptional regulator [Paraburkholderia unamae]PVX76266.1 AraC-like DNA-binding protein [Paraburkholderia unamae]RAR58316.1 AraC-like DNA-binding protein [Paraburkholderia unamae]CAG9270915.1 AraC-type DNA-binding protein [Paraburkholderia unamae]
METMLRAVSMGGYFDVARRVGLNPVELAQQAGVDAAALANPDARIPAAAACLLLERSAEKAACPTFALQMAEMRRKFGTGVVNVLLAHKRTLREVLLATAEYRHLLNEALAVYVEDAGETVTIREELVVDPGIPTHQAIELAVGVLARHSSALLGDHWKPRAVHFVHQGPPSLAFHRRFFGCPLEFGSDFNGFVCAAADLDYPNPAADPELVRYAESLADSLNAAGVDSTALEVRKAIYLLLPLEQATVDLVAAHLHVSVRTMQRQLGLAETSFTRLVEEVRGELAVRYMSNPRYPIGRVSALLGYAQQGSFTNWFSARFGMTPRDWRNSRPK